VKQIGISKNFLKLLKSIGRQADREGCHSYLVGGLVRDLFLSIRHAEGAKDLDVSLENAKDLKLFIKKLSKNHKISNLKIYGEFGTASLLLGDNPVDFAMSRSEKYIKPGALPQVSPGNMLEDLKRRDFSINAMAILLNHADFGTLYDPLNGLDDLQKKQVRVLHDKSFQDDPTRIFRALRFCARFNFTLEKSTEKLLRTAIKNKYLKNVSQERITNEFLLALKERFTGKCLKMFDKYGISFTKTNNLAIIDKCLYNHYNDAPVSGAADFAAVKLALLLRGLNLDEQKQWLSRMKISRKVSQEIISVYRFINGEIMKPAVDWSKNFLKVINVRRARVFISGRFLMDLGFKPGPLYKKIITEVNRNKEIKNLRDAKKFILEKYKNGLIL